MSSKSKQSKRLPRNFHKTFKPERHYINAMLHFAASGKTGDFQEIASVTGIPMGKSSGKVPAILDFCRGMGLVSLSDNSERSSQKTPELTFFGRVVLLEDPFLKCEVTQWVAHFNMCNPKYGADVWYHTFFVGAQALGDKCKRGRLEDHLRLVYGPSQKNMIGPMVGMYEDEASFKNCSVLSELKGMVSKKAAPIVDELGRGYGAWIIQLINDFFPTQQQVPIIDLDKLAGWRTIPAWSITSAIAALDLVEKKGLISVDRHMEPWLIRSEVSVELAWQDIYMDII